MRYDTIRYDTEYLTCSKKLTGSHLSLPHGINKKLKCETKNKMMSVIGPVQSFYHAGSPVKVTRGQSNLTKSASREAHSPVRGHPRGSKVVPLNSWGRVSY